MGIDRSLLVEDEEKYEFTFILFKLDPKSCTSKRQIVSLISNLSNIDFRIEESEEGPPGFPEKGEWINILVTQYGYTTYKTRNKSQNKAKQLRLFWNIPLSILISLFGGGLASLLAHIQGQIYELPTHPEIAFAWVTGGILLVCIVLIIISALRMED